MNTPKRYKVHTRNPRYFDSPHAACVFANNYEKRTGHIVAVTECKPRKRKAVPSCAQ